MTTSTNSTSTQNQTSTTIIVNGIEFPELVEFEASNTQKSVQQNNNLTQPQQMSYNESMDYSFISALLLLWIALISTFDFLRRMASKDKF